MPIEEQFPQAPASPATVPGVQETLPGQEDLSQEEMISNLKELMARINSKYADFNSGKAISESKIMQSKSQSLREVFDLLQSAGVDPSNVEQVQGFLDKIKNSNPELYQQIEKVLAEIMGGEAINEGVAVDTGEIPQNLNSIGQDPSANMNININETPQQNI